jgi:hypothetical protein
MLPPILRWLYIQADPLNHGTVSAPGRMFEERGSG